MKRMLVLLFLATASAFAQTDVVKFSAKIANRNSDTLTVKGKNFTRVIPGKNGVFSDSFAVTKGFYQIGDGTEVTRLFLSNGFDLNLTMDAKQFDESIVYKGKGEKENNFLAQMALDDEKMEELMASADQATFDAAVAKSTQSYEAKLKDTEMDESFRTMMGGAIKQQSQMMAMAFQQAQTVKKLQGNMSPGFDYENHKGGKTKLADLKGKYVYIDTWATWCGPCRQEIPFLQKVEEKYHGKNIEFVSISVDVKKDYEKWKTFVKDKNLGGMQLIADNDWNSQFIRDFGINSIPRFILIGPDGKVIDANAARPSMPELQQQLDKLLN